jgi:hypothetical protein
MVRSRVRRERTIRIGSWLILVLALLPAISYMGHWPVGGADVHADVHDSSTAAEHEVHCHGGVSHCAGGEAMVGSTWVGDESDLLVLNAPKVGVETDQQLAAIEGEPAVILQPPRSV